MNWVEELTDLAIEVTGMGRKRWDLLCESMKSDQEMNRIMREEWHSKPRDSEEAVREYYRSSDIWFINTFKNGVGALVALANGVRGELPLWALKFVDLLQGSGGVILDFGGGFLKDTWPLIAAGYRVEVAEVSGPVTNFLKAVIAKAGLEKKVGVVDVVSESPLSTVYDGAVSFETLEHLKHPDQLVAHLHRHIKKSGPFVFSATFGAPEHAPYHVASNAHFGDEVKWASVLSSVGFSPCWSDPNGGGTKIWKA